MGSRPRGAATRLVIAFRGEAVMEVPLDSSCIEVGSAEGNDLRLSGCGVMAHHLVLRRRGGRWVAIACHGSPIVDPAGRVMHHVVLAAGIRVGIGEFSLEASAGGVEDSLAGTGTLAEPSASRQRPRMSLRCVGGRPALLHLGVRGATIGRDPACDLVVDDPYASLGHARVTAVGDGWLLVDMGSRNGTRLDGRLVDGAEISPGSRIVVGRSLVECVDPDPGPESPGGWIETPGLRPAIDEADLYAATSLPVLLVGESGAGKEGLARRIHERGARSSGPFVPVNCGALPESLADSLLFGHVRGAFTGASEEREGLVRASSGGTLFLDEVGELSPAVQARLLRVIEEGVVRPLGTTRTQDVDLRIVAATHRDLACMVRDGRFRLDLYHRIAVLAIDVPPLRARSSDIEILARGMVARGEVRGAGLSDEALAVLRDYHWPGNVRELRNVLSRAAMRSGGGVILPAHLVFVGGLHEPTCTAPALPVTGAEAHALLARAGGNVSRAARMAGVSRSTLRDRLRRLEVSRAGG